MLAFLCALSTSRVVLEAAEELGGDVAAVVAALSAFERGEDASSGDDAEQRIATWPVASQRHERVRLLERNGTDWKWIRCTVTQFHIHAIIKFPAHANTDTHEGKQRTNAYTEQTTKQ